MMPDIPQPNSRTVEEESRTPSLKTKLVDEVIHCAKRGVTFQTTAKNSQLPQPVNYFVAHTCTGCSTSSI